MANAAWCRDIVPLRRSGHRPSAAAAPCGCCPARGSGGQLGGSPTESTPRTRRYRRAPRSAQRGLGSRRLEDECSSTCQAINQRSLVARSRSRPLSVPRLTALLMRCGWLAWIQDAASARKIALSSALGSFAYWWRWRRYWHSVGQTSSFGPGTCGWKGWEIHDLDTRVPAGSTSSSCRGCRFFASGERYAVQLTATRRASVKANARTPDHLSVPGVFNKADDRLDAAGSSLSHSILR